MTSQAELAASVRAALSMAGGSIREVKMFGGIGFMLNGNMVAAVSKRGLLLRVGRDGYAAALAREGARAVEMRGRQMQGYISLEPSVLTDPGLKTWIAEASAFVRTLPPKREGAKPERKKTERKGARE
jgi:TfoX/Sxy family transcriptional regulator of competence genes